MIYFAGLLPMLLDERKVAPEDQDGWVVEPKHDGYRSLAQFGGGQCALRSKSGTDITKWFPEIRDALASLDCGQMIVDGEMCVLNEFGCSDFMAVHARARRRKYSAGDPVVTYCVFDLLEEDSQDITEKPLLWRKERLARLLEKLQPAHTLYVQHMSGEDVIHPISWLYASAIQLELEGVVAKRADSIYQPGVRSPDWFKLKRPGAVPAKRFKR